MSALPKRRVLRGIVQDAIDDRLELDDATIRDRTEDLIRRYRALMPRLADRAPPLADEDRQLLATACRHARIWREGLLDAYAHTDDAQTKREIREDIDRVTRTERALGVERVDPFAGGTTISVFDLMKRIREEGPTGDGLTSPTLS